MMTRHVLNTLSASESVASVEIQNTAAARPANNVLRSRFAIEKAGALVAIRLNPKRRAPKTGMLAKTMRGGPYIRE
ncbi:MAG TPA: hypothetical protein VHW24_25765 [Bryobacteraceae bacterium]|nr:hypothetical protein [Bryobacteraceae bacterium]